MDDQLIRTGAGLALLFRRLSNREQDDFLRKTGIEKAINDLQNEVTQLQGEVESEERRRHRLRKKAKRRIAKLKNAITSRPYKSKRGPYKRDALKAIRRLHRNYGNRWSKIAAFLYAEGITMTPHAVEMLFKRNS